jgi:hypothetical protein
VRWVLFQLAARSRTTMHGPGQGQVCQFFESNHDELLQRGTRRRLSCAAGGAGRASKPGTSHPGSVSRGRLRSARLWSYVPFMDRLSFAIGRAQLCAQRAELSRDPEMRARWQANATAWAEAADLIARNGCLTERQEREQTGAPSEPAKPIALTYERLKRTFRKRRDAAVGLDAAIRISQLARIRSKRRRKRRERDADRPPPPRLTVIRADR